VTEWAVGQRIGWMRPIQGDFYIRRRWWPSCPLHYCGHVI